MKLSEQGCESAVMFFLLEEDRPVWAVEELGREIGDRIDAEDACHRLQAAGLVHRCGDLVLATRAAQRAHALPG